MELERLSDEEAHAFIREILPDAAAHPRLGDAAREALVRHADGSIGRLAALLTAALAMIGARDMPGDRPTVANHGDGQEPSPTIDKPAPLAAHGSAMSSHQIEGERRLSVASEVGPVHGDDDCLARADLMRNPAGKAVPHVDILVAEKTVNLLDRMLGHQTARLCQRLPNYRNGQRRAGHHTQRRVRQTIHPLGMRVMLI